MQNHTTINTDLSPLKLIDNGIEKGLEALLRQSLIRSGYIQDDDDHREGITTNKLIKGEDAE